MMEKRIEETAQKMEKVAIENGYFVSADGRVSEEAAAKLIGVAEGTLRNWRYEGKAPTFYKRPLSGCGTSYRLMDIASWLEEQRKEE